MEIKKSLGIEQVEALYIGLYVWQQGSICRSGKNVWYFLGR